MEDVTVIEYEVPAFVEYEEDDAWTFAPCGQD